MIDAPVFIRQLSQRHMTACAVLLDIIMWRLMAARQTQLSLLGGMSLGGAVLHLVSETRSSEKGQKRERGLKRHMESYIVKSDGLLSMHWLSFVPPQSNCAAIAPVWPASTSWAVGTLKLDWTLTQKTEIKSIKIFFFPLLALQLANESRKKTPRSGWTFWLVGSKM